MLTFVYWNGLEIEGKIHGDGLVEILSIEVDSEEEFAEFLEMEEMSPLWVKLPPDARRWILKEWKEVITDKIVGRNHA